MTNSGVVRGDDHVVVVGGGIAGASAAYSLALAGKFKRITLIEAERQLAHHTTGRSAALFTLNYGAGPVRPLSAGSLAFFESPPEGLIDVPILTPRGIMHIATPDGHELLDVQLAEGQAIDHTIVEIDADQACDIAPHVIVGDEHRMMLEPNASDIDVAALHQAFVRGFRALGGEIATTTRLDNAIPAGNGWRLDTSTGMIDADVLVNAAGAWADLVAESAGVAPVGLAPMRRTAFMVKSHWSESGRFPVVAETHHHWYFRPDGTQFMCSPADETPSEPCDAKPEEIDIARTIDLLNAATHLDIRAVTSSWAGLRTFSPDRSMVLGPEPSQPNFIWCAGQGGTGIQTSPAAGQLLADLVTEGQPSARIAETGLDLAALLPDRYR